MRNKVLVTSRSTKVSKIIGTYTTHMLKDLSKNECWSLFQKQAFSRQDNLSSETRSKLEKKW